MSTLPKPCTNCGGTEFYLQNVNPRGGLGPLPFGLFQGLIHSHMYRIRICGECGLTEWFVPQDALQTVKKRFVREGGWPAPPGSEPGSPP